jgi:hypothetical protein
METGEILSRRQYDKLVGQAGLHTKKSLAAKAKNDRIQREYERIVARYVDRQRELGVRGADGGEYTKGEARKSADLKRHYQDLKQQGRKKPGKRTKADNAAYAKTLKALGLRDGIPDWVPPGASAGYRRGTFDRGQVRNWNRSGPAGRAARSAGRGIVQ